MRYRQTNLPTDRWRHDNLTGYKKPKLSRYQTLDARVCSAISVQAATVATCHTPIVPLRNCKVIFGNKMVLEDKIVVDDGMDGEKLLGGLC